MQKEQDILNAQKDLNKLLENKENSIEEEEIKRRQDEYEKRFKKETGLSVEEYIQETIKKKFKTQLTAISNYMNEHKMTLDEMVDEVKQKKSKLTRSSRDLLLTLKRDYLNECI